MLSRHKNVSALNFSRSTFKFETSDRYSQPTVSIFRFIDVFLSRSFHIKNLSSYPLDMFTTSQWDNDDALNYGQRSAWLSVHAVHPGEGLHVRCRNKLPKLKPVYGKSIVWCRSILIGPTAAFGACPCYCSSTPYHLVRAQHVFTELSQNHFGQV